jgi:methionyl-tRNA formyltransferase
MKIVFLGTPAFAVPFLNQLIQDPDTDVLAVVAQPDKPSGRGGKLTPPATKVVAQEHGISVLQPTSLKKDPTIMEELRALNADAFVVVAYGKIIPAQILEIPRLGCINVHPSKLPLYRGPSPMQWAIKEGDVSTGVSIMLLDEGMDTGPILAFESLELDADETYPTLQSKVHEIGPKLLVNTLKRYEGGEITPAPQDDAQASISKLLSRDDGHLDWNMHLATIDRLHRAFMPWPGTWSVWNRDGKELRVKLLSMRPADFRANVPPGTVVAKDEKLFVDCADGTFEISELQLEGKPKMKPSDFIRGYADIDGAILS